MERFLANIGKEVQSSQFDQEHEEHTFSEEYKSKKQKILSSLKPRKKPFWWRLANVAVVAVVLVGASFATYAAVKMITVKINGKEVDDSININIDHKGNEKIFPINITANYLPKGFSETGKNEYSENGEADGSSISIMSGGYFEKYTLPDVSDYEEQNIGKAKAVITYTAGYNSLWDIYLFYEETGHAIEVLGTGNIAKEEMLKVCENITYKEMAEEDIDPDYHAFSYEGDQWEYDEEWVLRKQDQIKSGDEFPAYVSDAEFEHENEVASLSVKSVKVSDAIDTKLLTKDTTSDYQQVMEYIQKDGTLKPHERIAEVWRDNALKQENHGKVAMKNVAVTVEIKNLTDKDFQDVSMQPWWKVLSFNAAGVGRMSGDSSTIPALKGDESYRSSNTYGIQNDGVAYYFDSSAYPRDNHFYNMKLDANETKEVEMWFAVPEDLLDEAYLIFDLVGEGGSESFKYMKLTE